MTAYRSMVPLLPPRPDKMIPPAFLRIYESKGWYAQGKLNGQYSVVYVSPEKQVTVLNRHLEPHKNWAMPRLTENFFGSVPGRGWSVFACELVHAKVTNGPKNVHYVHDVLVDDGDLLVGSTYAQRYARLMSLFHRPIDESLTHWVVNEQVWLAKNHRRGFRELFEKLDRPEDEGLVLKDPQGTFQLNNSNKWLVKCRRPHANFMF